ncbi:MAG: TfoX/Sxy family DNA transformation protein [Fimbriimonadaceae bacterium]|nr:TfoX/Sxy family DNA transformation protein [Fimbriimonadaceae bacterium]
MPDELDGYGRPLRRREVVAPVRRRPLRGAANLSFELVGQLELVGVRHWERLVELGAKEVWLRLRQQFPERDNFASLLALQGAIDDEDVTFLPLEQVDALRRWWLGHLEAERLGGDR